MIPSADEEIDLFKAFLPTFGTFDLATRNRMLDYIVSLNKSIPKQGYPVKSTKTHRKYRVDRDLKLYHLECSGGKRL